MALYVESEFMRFAVQHLKQRFIRWRDPPVELPAESVIYEALGEIIEAYENMRASKATTSHSDG